MRRAWPGPAETVTDEPGLAWRKPRRLPSYRKMSRGKGPESLQIKHTCTNQTYPLPTKYIYWTLDTGYWTDHALSLGQKWKGLHTHSAFWQGWRSPTERQETSPAKRSRLQNRQDGKGRCHLRHRATIGLASKPEEEPPALDIAALNKRPVQGQGQPMRASARGLRLQ